MYVKMCIDPHVSLYLLCTTIAMITCTGLVIFYSIDSSSLQEKLLQGWDTYHLNRLSTVIWLLETFFLMIHLLARQACSVV